ncbi:MAG: CHAT domain-containing protein [Croceibacterium sp.]
MASLLAAGALLLCVQPASAQTDGYTDPAARLAEVEAQIPAGPLRDGQMLRAERAALLVQLDRLDDARADLEALEAAVPASDKALRAEIAVARALYHANRQENADGVAAARQALQLRGEVYGPDGAEAAVTRVLLGKLLISQGEFDEGLPLAQAGWDTLRELRPAGDSERLDAGFQYALGLTYSRQAAQAEALVRSLLAGLPALPPRHVMRAKLPNLLGTELLMQGRTLESIPYHAQAVEQGQQVTGLSLGERADHVSAFGVAMLYLDRPGDALGLFEQSAKMFADAGAVTSASGGWISAGTAADRAGDRAKALLYRQRGMELAASTGDQHPLAVALNRFKLAQSLAHAGRLEEAEPMEQQAVDTIATLRPATNFQVLNSRIALGWIKALRGDVPGGLALVKPAFRSSVAVATALEVAQNRVMDVLGDVEAYSQALEVARLAGDTEFVFEIMQVMIESDASRAAVAVTQRELSATSELGRLLKQRQEAGTAVAAADSALLKAEAAGQGVEMARTALDATRAVLDERDAELDMTYPAFRDLLRPRAVTLAQVQAALGADEAVLLVNESDLGIYTLAVTRSGVVIGHDPIRRQALRDLVGAIRRGIDAGLQGRSGRFDLAGAARLHDAILTPEVARAVAGKALLRFATGDILSALPLSLLVSRAGPDAARSQFLIDDHAVSVLPSLAALQGQDERARRPGRLVAVGAPDLAQATDNLPATLRGNLAPLPGALREMEQVASLLGKGASATNLSGPTILSGTAATETAVKALDLADVGVLLFATHGLVGGRTGGTSEPALVLTPPVADTAQDDGLLTASEAALLDIGADWVILSACDTAAGGRPDAAGYTGLARGFLFAGARRVVASHWPVRDDISARLTTGIVRAAQDGAGAAQSLRRAVLAVKRDNPEPALWAPFMVVAR